MKIENLALDGIKLVTNKRFGDDRGFFCERYREDAFKEAGITEPFIQENFSRSEARVLRGLHYQYDLPQGKLITCLQGHITDIVVDIRAKSKTFGQHLAVEIDGNSPTWLWIPAGFAHGFCVNSREGADILYKVTSYYNPQGEGGINWQDPDLKVAWPIAEPLLSGRDLSQQSFKKYAEQPRF